MERCNCILEKSYCIMEKLNCNFFLQYDQGSNWSPDQGFGSASGSGFCPSEGVVDNFKDSQVSLTQKIKSWKMEKDACTKSPFLMCIQEKFKIKHHFLGLRYTLIHCKL